MAAVAALFVGLAGSVRASGIDSEHLFGLTEGSDIGAAGEREIELEAAARFGKSSGTYRVLSQATALKLTLTDSFRVAPLVAIIVTASVASPAWTTAIMALSEVAFEMKYRALDRQSAPFGLTFGMTPAWGHVDEANGERVKSRHQRALADKELIANRLFAAFNVAFATGAARVCATGVWEHNSALPHRRLSAADVRARLRQRRAALRTRLRRHGIGLVRRTCLFAGPAIYIKLSEQAWMSALWNAQIAGRASGEAGSLDLTNFERHLVKMRLGIAF